MNTSQRSISRLITSCDRRPVEANVSSQPSGSNLMSSASPKPALSSSSTCWNAARSTAKSPGEAMKTRIVRMAGMRDAPVSRSGFTTVDPFGINHATDASAFTFKPRERATSQTRVRLAEA